MNANESMDFGFGGIWGVIMLLIIAGIFTNGGFGFGGNSGQITNDFLYTNLASDVRSNAAAINTTDRDVLENRYQNSLQTNTLQNQASVNALQAQADLNSCCCELKSLVRDEVQGIKDLINANTIQDLRDTKQGYELVAALGNQTNTISSRFGSWYLNAPYAPYYGNYPYGTYGTTII